MVEDPGMQNRTGGVKRVISLALDVGEIEATLHAVGINRDELVVDGGGLRLRGFDKLPDACDERVRIRVVANPLLVGLDPVKAMNRQHLWQREQRQRRRALYCSRDRRRGVLLKRTTWLRQP